LIVLIELSREKLEEQRNIERDRLQHLATHDPLTQIPNRALFEEALERVVSGHRLSDTSAILFYIDLDDFKPVNDRWGHDTGDKVLQVIAARLKASTREKDIVARLGGDEFAVLMNGIEKNIPVDSLAETIHNRIAEEIHISGQHFHLSCSIGICIFPEQADNADQLWQRADNAMYEAKKKSRRWHLYA
jgi:diguanylate cyclase (GGDEF)-like protein